MGGLYTVPIKNHWPASFSVFPYIYMMCLLYKATNICVLGCGFVNTGAVYTELAFVTIVFVPLVWYGLACLGQVRWLTEVPTVLIFHSYNCSGWIATPICPIDILSILPHCSVYHGRDLLVKCAPPPSHTYCITNLVSELTFNFLPGN